MKLSRKLVEHLQAICGDGSGYVIGSAVFGGHNPMASDLDLLVYEARDDVAFLEDSEIVKGSLSVPLSICRRPLDEWRTPTQVLTRSRPQTWKEFSSPEDCVMAASHGMHVGGPSIGSETISPSQFLDYLSARARILRDFATRDISLVEPLPEGDGPDRFYSKAAARIAREYAFASWGIKLARIHDTPDAYTSADVPDFVGNIVKGAVASLLGSGPMLTMPETALFIGWVNDTSTSSGHHPWATMFSSPAKVKRPIVNVNS